MQRRLSELRLSSGEIRRRVRIEDDSCGLEFEWRLAGFMKELIESPDLLNIGAHKPHKLTFSYDGVRWVAEGEVLTEEG